MKIGDLVQIKSTAFYSADYHWLLLNERMLVTVVIDGVVECISESGVNRFPMADMEVADEDR